MDSNLRAYLFRRQILFWLSQIPGIFFTFCLIGLVYTLTSTVTLFQLWLTAISFSYCFFGPTIIYLVRLFTYYQTTPLVKHYYPLDKTQKNTFNILLQKINRKISIHPNILFFTHPSPDIGTECHKDKSYIFLSYTFTNIPRGEIEAIIAHEVTHVLAKDNLKSYFMEFIKNLSRSLLWVLWLLCLVKISFLSMVFYLLIFIIQKYRFSDTLTNIGSKIKENTADGFASRLGYGPGLIKYLNNQRDIEKYLPLYLIANMPHDTINRRIKNITENML